jgi:threonine/homoserine/homoserine lactone efflux protein
MFGVEGVMTLDLILLALAIALEPLPLTAYLLMLSSDGGTRKGLGFLLGWVITLVGVVVLTLVLTAGKPLKSGSAPSTASLVVKIVLGAGLLWLAWRQRSRRGRPSSPPSWMAKIDHLGFAAAMFLGFVLQPWALVAAGAATVAIADLSQASTWVSLIVFCLLATVSYVAMQIYVVLSPDAARVRLDGLNNWITGHRDEVIIVASTAVGLWLISHSAYLLVT